MTVIEWKEDVIFLSSKPYGEKGQIVSVLSKNSGRYNGWIFGGNSYLKKNLIQQGNFLNAIWKARVSEQLGTFKFELIKCNSAHLMNNPIKLACLNSLCCVLDKILPERESNLNIYMASKTLIDVICDIDADDVSSVKAYINWELGLISFLGFSINLKRCSVTNLRENLAYVSPKTGSSVSFEIGNPYQSRLLVLPNFLGGNFWNQDNTFFSEIEEGLKLSKFFLKKYFFEFEKNIPEPRERLNQIFKKSKGER